MAKTITGYCVLVLGMAFLLADLARAVFGHDAPWGEISVIAALGCILLVFGIYLVFEIQLLEHVKIEKLGIDLAFAPVEKVRPKELPPEVKQTREEYARANPPPASDAPAFNALTDVPDMVSMPGSDPMVPMYLLDRNFRILDWNEAFALAFDRSMEGRRGQGAIEWVYLLDNFKESLDHANQAFANPNCLPHFDKEELRFTSERYGPLDATKRAYQFTDDAGGYAGWLVVLDVRFKDPAKAKLYRFELIRTLQRSLLWTDYSLSYDQILTNSPLYEELLNKMSGEAGKLAPIAPDARILDLGSGTGNLACRLSNGRRIIFCIENNRTMLAVLQGKCRDSLRRDNLQAGTIALKQDVSSLFGLPRNYFDVVLANHVFYNLANPETAIEEIARLLKPGGELRVSGPAKGFDLVKLFRRLKKDLEIAGKFQQLKTDFEHAQWINSLLEPDLRAWSERDVPEMFRHARLEYLPNQDTPYYAGNGLIMVARKP